MTDQEILEKTEDYYCWGENEEDLKIRMEYARKQKAGSLAVDFGTGEARTALVVAMANPKMKVLTFDHGRRDISNDDLYKQTLERAEKCGVKNLQMAIGDATILETELEIAMLNVDIEDGYDQARIIAERWFPQVRKGGVIFIQTWENYQNNGIKSGLKYPEMRRAFEEYFKKNYEEYVISKQYGNTRVILKI